MRQQQRVRWLRRVALAVLAGMVVTAWGSTVADAATVSTQFCRDTAELQGWIAQGFQPGIDQYTTHPNTSYVKGLAQYLDKLSAEAPAAERADLSVWASFTGKVAAGASQTVLGSEVAAARVAAARVKVWLATKSGCPQDYTTAGLPVAHKSSHKVLYWVLGGIGGVILLSLLGAVAGSSGGRAAAGRGSIAGGPTSGSSSPQRCGACNGAGSTPCGTCQGRGVIDVHTPSANAPYADSTSGCSRCGRSGKIRCSMCSGSGVRG